MFPSRPERSSLNRKLVKSRYHRLPLSLELLEHRDVPSYAFVGGTADTTLDLTDGSGNLASGANVAIAPSGSNPTASISLGANTFNFFGTDYGTVFVSYNGLLTFGAANNLAGNASLGTTLALEEAAVAPLWDQWFSTTAFDSKGVISKLDTANNRLIVQWDRMEDFVGSDDITFQAILALNTGITPGNIEFNYLDTATGNSSTADGKAATVGVKDANAGPASPTPFFTQVSHNALNPNVASGKKLTLNWQNTAPQNLALDLAAAIINENDILALGGNFTDPDAIDTHTVTINWGDGSANDTVTPAKGVYSFAGLNHKYRDNPDLTLQPNSKYTITATFKDSQGASSVKTALVQVNNVVPSVSAGVDTTIDEGGTFTRAGSFFDPGTLDSPWVADVDYGDGSGKQPLGLTGATFSLGHTYADQGKYPVTVYVRDRDNATGQTTIFVTVNNVLPTLALDGGLGSPGVNEGTELNLATIANFVDPGLNSDEVQSWSINWGDGTTDTKALPGTSGTIGGKHTYADNGQYTVTVSVLDDVGPAVSKTFLVAVNNVAPVTALNGSLSATQSVSEGKTITINDLATFVDPGFDNTANPNQQPGGSKETFTYTVNWGDGTTNTVGAPALTQVGGIGVATAGKFGASHIYADDGKYTVTVNVADDDGGVSPSKTFFVQVNNDNPAITSPATDRSVNEGAVLTISTLATFTDYGFSNSNNPLEAGGSKETFTYSINWGDGTAKDTGAVANVTQGSAGVLTSGAIQNIAHVFADDGKYTVTLAIDDDNGGTVSQQFFVTVGNVAPTVAVIGDQTVNEGNKLSLPTVATFTDPGFNNAANPNGASVETFTYSINWGDGTAADGGPVTAVMPGSAGTATGGSVNDVAHIYADDGTYTVTVTITDDNAGTTSKSFLVTVNNVAPTIGAIASDTTVNEGSVLSIPDLFSFFDPGFDNANNPNRQPGGSQESFSYTLNWGDGTGVEGGPVTAVVPGSVGSTTAGKVQNVSHTFADNGQYTVTVSLVDDDGGQTSKTFQVTVANVAPTVSIVGNKTIDEGSLLSVPNIVTFTDPGFNNPSNPSGASVESFTYTINWGDGSSVQSGSVPAGNVTNGGVGVLTKGFLDGSHTYADNGVYTVSVTVADDNSGSTTKSFQVTVGNVAPTVGIGGDKTVNEGGLLSVPNIVTFTDPGFNNPINPNGASVESFTYSINWGDGTSTDGGPVTAVTNGSVGVLTKGSLDGSHTYADDGDYTVSVTITDDNAGVTTKTFQVTVSNVAPTVSIVGNKTIDEGSLLSVPNIVTFTDPGFNNPSNPNGASVESFTYTINWGDGTSTDGGPVTAVTNGGVGVLTKGFLDGSHTYADNGVYTVSVTVVDDNSGSTTKSFQVTVNNVAPVVMFAGNQTIAEGVNLDIAKIATWLDSGFNNPTNPNQQPSGSKETFTYSINWGDGTTAVAGTVPGANVVSGSPGTATTGFLDAGHTFADNGSYTVTVTISDDDGAAVSKDFQVTVTNVAPTLVKVAADRTATEGSLVAVPTLANFSDPGFHNSANPNQQPGGSKETFTYSINWGDGASETKAVANFATGSVGTPSGGSFGGSHTYADNGTYTVTATVLDDDTGLSNQVSFTVTVTNVAPTINVSSSLSIVEGSLLDLAPIATLTDPGFTNATGTPATAETFTYAVNWGDGSAMATGNATVTEAGFPGSPTLGRIAASHTFADDGDYTVTVTVTDDDGDATSKTFTVTVLNSSPVLAVIAPQTFAEGETFVLPTIGTLRDAGYANAANPNGSPNGSQETFTYSVNWGDGTTPDTGTAGLTQLGSAGVPTLASFGNGHTYDRAGTFNVVVRTTDDDGGFDEKTFPITVTNVAPTLVLANSNLVGTEGTTIDLPTIGTFTDPGFSASETYSYRVEWGDGEVSTGAAQAKLGGVGVPTRGEFGSSHAYGDNGLYSVRVVLTDSNGGSSEGTFQINVANVAPSLSLNVQPIVTVPEGSPLSLPNLANFGDPAFAVTETFTYTIEWGDGSKSSSKASIFQVGGPDKAALGKFGEAHTYQKNGDYPVTVTLADKDGGTSTATFTVKAVNVAPTNLIYTLAPSPSDEGSTVELSGSFTDPGLFDPHTVTVNWGDGSAPAIFSLLPSVTFFSTRNVGGNFLTHTYAQNGDADGYEVTVTVSDDAGLFTTQAAAFTVRNVAPDVTIAIPQKVTRDVRFVVTSDVTDPGILDQLSYAWTVTDPDGNAVFTATTQNLEYTAPRAGRHTVTLTVSDQDGGSTTKTASIRVQNGEIFVLAADANGGPRVAIFDAKSQMRITDFFAYEESYSGGVRVAVGDISGDGTADIVTATGKGGGPRVRVIDSETLENVADFFVYEESYRGGMFLAVGDVDGDGFDDIATAPDEGGGPRVKVVSGRTLQPIYDDFVFDPELRNGTRIAVNDVNGDGFADLVVGSGPGVTARVRVLDIRNNRVLFDENVYDESFQGGVYLAAGDIQGDGRADIVVAPGVGGGPHVRVYDVATTKVVAEFFAYEASYTGGVRVAAFDYDGDGRADVLTGTGPGGGPAHRIWKPFTNEVLESFFSFEETFLGGVYVGAGD